MRWTCLGHAGWLAEVGGQRVLMDPVFEATFHEGLFEVFPPRSIDLEGLAADVIVVTHRHPDHFDPATLQTLAARWPSARFITADERIAQIARALGFQSVSCVPERTVVPMGTGALYTTPSHCDVVEWGIVAWDPTGTAWNMVDSVVGGPEGVRSTLEHASLALGVPALAQGPDLALVRWCPLLQADGAVSGCLGGSLKALHGELENAVAVGAKAIIPGSCGDRYVGWGAWQNQSVYPTTETRFLRDLEVLLPSTPTFLAVPGHRWRVQHGRCVPEAPVRWVTVLPREDDRIFAPFVLPPIVDPGPPEQEDQTLLCIAEWVGDALVPSLARWGRTVQPTRPLSLVLEIVLATRTVGLTLRLESGEVQVVVGSDPDHDGLDRIAGTVMRDVIEGRSHWGRALMGGRMRSVRRAYEVREHGLLPYPLPAFLVYLALTYSQSTERWLECLLSDLGVELGDRAMH